ncbi:MAG: hypothetical protein CMJ20_11670 [Phycisphaeraceae bacterium]|nr:hypothetical protein [Phycisphaeraceae bacterium]
MTKSRCNTCLYLRVISAPSGAHYFFCKRSNQNDFPKYPPQPVFKCNGYASGDNEQYETIDFCED